MLFVLLFISLCVFGHTKDVCRMPKNWKSNYDFNYKTRRTEWATPNAKTDFYKLVLSWSPSYCKQLPAPVRGRSFQCQYDDFGLVVHGFWAQSKNAPSLRQHPRNCRDEKKLNLTTIKRYFCMMPDESLIQSEWEKHGTCVFPTGEAYLNTIEQLYSKLVIPDLKALLVDKRVDQYKIKKAFLEKNPRLRANQITVFMKNKELVDIKICYDLKLNFTNCYG